MTTIVTVLGKDRPGIIAGISTILYELDINVLNVSQTIVDGYFTMTMVVDISNVTKSFEEVKAIVAKAGEPLNVKVRMQRSEIFNAMHQL